MCLNRTTALSTHSCKFEAELWYKICFLLFAVYVLLLAHCLSIKGKIFPVELEFGIKATLLSH